MADAPLDDDDMTTSPTEGGGTEGSSDGVDGGSGPDTGPLDSSDGDGSDGDASDGGDADGTDGDATDATDGDAS